MSVEMSWKGDFPNNLSMHAWMSSISMGRQKTKIALDVCTTIPKVHMYSNTEYSLVPLNNA